MLLAIKPLVEMIMKAGGTRHACNDQGFPCELKMTCQQNQRECGVIQTYVKGISFHGARKIEILRIMSKVRSALITDKQKGYVRFGECSTGQSLDFQREMEGADLGHVLEACRLESSGAIPGIIDLGHRCEVKMCMEDEKERVLGADTETCQ
jgi:hypothetical protein